MCYIMWVWHKFDDCDKAATLLPVTRQGTGGWAGRWVWVLTHPSLPWKGSHSKSLGDQSTISVCPRPTGGTACWKWRPVASTLSLRRAAILRVHFVPHDWLNDHREHLGCRQVCAMESASARKRGFQLPFTAGCRVRMSLTLPSPEYNAYLRLHTYD